MEIISSMKKRIQECERERDIYSAWLTKLRFPNLIFVGIGSLLAFFGGAATVTELLGPKVGGIMALIGGALTGLHNWLGCEAHQLECTKLHGQFESLKSRYEANLVEPNQILQLEVFRELELELAKVKQERKTRAWKGFLDFGTKT